MTRADETRTHSRPAPVAPAVCVTTTHLQQLDPGDLIPASRSLPPGCRIERAGGITADFSRFLYRSVGSGWNWTDRLGLARAEWDALLRERGSETWVLYAGGAPAGYAELAGRARHAGSTPDATAGTEVEIVYFGLFPERIGQGLGGPLLEEATRRAWDLASRWAGLAPVERVWVHTCSLDGPAALANYRARGFSIQRTESEVLTPGDAAAGLWPLPNP